MKMNKIKLGDVLDVKRGASLAGKYYSTDGDYIRLTLGNFNYPGGGFKKNSSKDDIYYVGPIRDEFILGKGDIITPLTEQVAGLLGETARIPEENLYIKSGDVGKVIPLEGKIDNSFAYYLLSSPAIKKQLGAAAQQTKIRHTSPEKIKDCIAWIPESIDYQHFAGEILDNINDIIENNTKIISELESLAKTIYDYWFLQFDFPDENGRPYRSSGGKMVWNEELKKEIPEGWEVGKLNKFLKSGNSKKTIFTSQYQEQGKYPVIDQSEKYIVGYSNEEEAVNYFDDAIIFGDHTKAIKYINFPFIRGADGTQIIRSNNENLPNFLLYQEIRTIYLPSQGYSRYFKFLKDTFIIIPSNDMGKQYYKSILPLLNMRKSIIFENKELTSLRDFLLPLLMNGQVKIKDY